MKLKTLRKPYHFVLKTKRVYVQFSELKIISLESQVIEKYSGARNHKDRIMLSNNRRK
jgi:hypothetical protein